MPRDSDASNRAIAETEHYMVWEVQAPDAETTYHVELGAATLHFYREEWAEFLQLMRDAQRNSA